jgi:hypothetical protein
VLTDVFASSRQVFDRVGEVRYKLGSKAVVFGSAVLEGGKLGSPGGHGSTGWIGQYRDGPGKGFGRTSLENQE